MRRLTPVPEQLLALAARQRGLVSVADCEASGIASGRRARLVERRVWRRVTRSVYDICPGRLATLTIGDRARRAAWAALLSYGPDAVAIGTSGLAMLGVEGLPLPATPQVALPGGRDAGRRDGIELRRFDAGMRLVEASGRLVAAPEWALAQAVPCLDRDHAVAVMDSAQHRGVLDADGVAYAHDLARGRRGVERTHPWWSLTDRRAESPLETFGRLDCHDVGIPPDQLQLAVRDPCGRLLGYGDLAHRQRSGRWLVSEMDGRDVHELPGALLHDRSRQNDFLLEGGVDVLRFSGRDVGPHHRIGRTVRRALGLPPS